MLLVEHSKWMLSKGEARESLLKGVRAKNGSEAGVWM